MGAKTKIRFPRLNGVVVVIAAALIVVAGLYLRRQQVLLDIIQRLSADSRVAEVIVTEKAVDAASGIPSVTLKFLEYDSRGNPLKPMYFHFPSDIVQFQALVIRFDDFYVRGGHPLKGKSAFIFTKAFSIVDSTVRVIDINESYEVPSGYRLGKEQGFFEKRLWERFWEYALDNERASQMGIKNAQIEAPGTKFKKGILYTIRIEHDGGLRIDTQPIAGILSGERLSFEEDSSARR